MDIVSKLKSDHSLEYWLRYSYDRMTNNRFHRQSIEEMVNHFKLNGYSDSDIENIAKLGHSRNEILWTLT